MTNSFGRIGDVILVENTDAHFGAAEEYFAVRVQFADKSEETLLFTWHEIEVAIARSKKNPEDVPVVDSAADKIRDLLD